MYYHYPKLMITLCFNLLMFNIFFIVFATVTSNSIGIQACEAIGILLHFFLLSTFFLMSVMGILRYLLITRVFTEIQHFNSISLLTSYCKPFIIILFYPPYFYLFQFQT
jgi:hypothetical protein